MPPLAGACSTCRWGCIRTPGQRNRSGCLGEGDTSAPRVRQWPNLNGEAAHERILQLKAALDLLQFFRRDRAEPVLRQRAERVAGLVHGILPKCIVIAGGT